MYDDVLVPVDTSPDSEAAVERAVSVARATDATVHLLFVVETPELAPLEATDARETLRELSKSLGNEALETAAGQAEDAGLDVVHESRDGAAHEEIADYAGSAGIDLVVMGTRGQAAHAGRRAGSTTERVLTLVDVPVVAVPPDGPAWGDGAGPSRILVPTDGSDAAERAANHALDLAAVFGATVDVVYVVDDAVHALEDAPRSIVGLLREGGERAVEAVAAGAHERDLRTTTEVVRGDPADELLDYADGVDADLLAMGTRGRGGTADRLLGSTTARVLGRSDRPVLTLR